MKHIPLYPFLLLFFISLAVVLQVLFTTRYRFESVRCSNPQVGEKFCYAKPECRIQGTDTKIILEDVLSLTNTINSETETYQQISIDYYDKGISELKTFYVYSILDQEVPTGGIQFPSDYGSSVGYYNLENGVSIYLMGLSSDWDNNSNAIVSLYTQAIGSCPSAPGTSNILEITDKGFVVTPNKNDKTLSIELLTNNSYSSGFRNPNLGISSTIGSKNIFTNFDDKKQLAYVQRIFENQEKVDVLNNLRISRQNQISTGESNQNKCLDPSGAPPECKMESGVPEFDKSTNQYRDTKGDLVNYCTQHPGIDLQPSQFQTNFYGFTGSVDSNGAIGNNSSVPFQDKFSGNQSKFSKGTQSANGIPLSNNYLGELDFCAQESSGTPTSPTRFPFTNSNNTNNVGVVWQSNQPNFQKEGNKIVLGFD